MARRFIGFVTVLACLTMIGAGLISLDEPEFWVLALVAAVAYLAGMAYFSAERVAEAIVDRRM